MNICHNYIPNKYATFNDKDPPWLNDHIKLLMKKKNVAFQKYLKVGKIVPTTLICEQVMQN